MKTLKITTDNKIRMIDINMSDYKAIQKNSEGISKQYIQSSCMSIIRRR